MNRALTIPGLDAASVRCFTGKISFYLTGYRRPAADFRHGGSNHAAVAPAANCSRKRLRRAASAGRHRPVRRSGFSFAAIRQGKTGSSTPHFKSNRSDAHKPPGSAKRPRANCSLHVAFGLPGTAEVVTVICGDFNTDPTEFRSGTNSRS